MRYLLAALVLLFLLPGAATAQEATLTTPEVLPSPPAVTKLMVAEVYLSRTGGYVTVEFQASTGVPRRTRTYALAQGDLVSFITAIDTVRATETGTVPRRFNFRVLGWLVDNGRIVDDSAVVIPVTLAP